MSFLDQKCVVEEGLAPKPNVTVSASAQDLTDIITRKKDGVKAFMQGKVRISGSMATAMKLQPLFLGK